MEENKNHNSFLNYFKCQTIGFIILCIKTDIKGLTRLQIIDSFFTTFAYIYIISIWLGLASMFATDLYILIKKNGKRERNNICIRI